MTVSYSIMLYCAEIWTDARKVQQEISVQTTGTLRVTCAYRTVSEAVVLVTASVILIDLLAMEKIRIYECKQDKNRKIVCSEDRTRTPAERNTA